MANFFPINDIVDAALAGTGTRIPFSPVANGSDAYRSTVFVASNALEQKIAAALQPYGITPTLGHDQTHRKIRRISLAIPAEEMKAAADLYNEQTLSHLKELTGQDWYYEASRRSYISAFMDHSEAQELRNQLHAAKLDDAATRDIRHDSQSGETGRSLREIAGEQNVAVTKDSTVVEVNQQYVGHWMATRSKAEQVGAAATRQGMVRG